MELDIHDVLGVSAVTSCFVILAARAPVQVDQAVVITSSDELLGFVRLDDVDVGAIGAGWVNSIDVPTELAGLAHPQRAFGGRGPCRILLLCLRVEEEKLVGSTSRTDETTV